VFDFIAIIEEIINTYIAVCIRYDLNVHPLENFLFYFIRLYPTPHQLLLFMFSDVFFGKFHFEWFTTITIGKHAQSPSRFGFSVGIVLFFLAFLKKVFFEFGDFPIFICEGIILLIDFSL
jgi:hypothetical protein